MRGHVTTVPQWCQCGHPVCTKILMDQTNPNKLFSHKTICLILVKVSNEFTVKPVLSDHLKIDKTKGLMENSSLLKVESIAECSPWSILQYF